MERATITKLPEGSLIHAGAGTLIALGWAGIIPGLIPTLALAALVTLVAVVPLVILGIAAAVLAAPPYLIWRLAKRGRPGRSDAPTAVSPALGALPLPAPHAC
jgi:hypothetical protein